MTISSSGLLPWGPTGPGGLSPLPAPRGNGQAPGDPRRLAQAAIETETQFLSHLLENLRQSLVRSLMPPRSENRGYQSLVDQHLARALTLGGGLGLARWLISDLEARISEDQKETGDAIRQYQRASDLAPARDVPVSGTP